MPSRSFFCLLLAVFLNLSIGVSLGDTIEIKKLITFADAQSVRIGCELESKGDPEVEVLQGTIKENTKPVALLWKGELGTIFPETKASGKLSPKEISKLNPKLWSPASSLCSMT